MYPFFDLDIAFQRFLIADLDRYHSASCIIDQQLHVAVDLVHLYVDQDPTWLQSWLKPCSERSHPLKQDRRWYPLQRLETTFIPHLFGDLAANPDQVKVVDDHLYVAVSLVAAFTVGDDDWLYQDGSSCDPAVTEEL